MIEKPETTRVIDADLVLLSMGFVHSSHKGLADKLGLKYYGRGNIIIDEKTGQTSSKKVFAAGDALSGASLVVRAIAAGSKAAEDIHNILGE